MSIKKRLTYSHICLFVLPLISYLIITAVADQISWHYLLHQTFVSLADFQYHIHLTQLVSRACTLGGLLLVLFLVNRQLTRGVLRRIEGSLNEICWGLRKLREDDLSYRLPQHQPDEFSAIRADFNAAAAQLEQLAEQEKRSEHNRQELLAGISHDLRSPLTAIRAYTEGLMDGVAQTDEQRQQYLAIIREKAESMQALVNQLFLFSRMDLGQNEDHPEDVSLTEELRLLCSVLTPEYADRGLDITLDAPENDPCPVLADPDTLHRIVSNLAENSCKYRTSDRGKLAISLHSEAEYVSLSLTDDGPGVPEEALPHIFDAFYRSDPSRNNKIAGSGLGLAIVSRAVRNMKGRIIARNVRPHGFRVEIQLPRQEVHHG